MTRTDHFTGRTLARNTAFNVGGQALPLLLAAVTIPPIARGLGTERFGVLAIIWALLTYFAELGFGRATIKFVAELLARREIDRLNPVLWGTVLVQGIAGVVGGLLVWLLAPVISERFLRADPAVQLEATRALQVLAVGVPALLLSSSFRGVLEAAQKFGWVNLVRVPANLASYALPLIGIYAGLELPGIVALLIAGRVLTLAAFWILAAVHFPELRRRPRLDRSTLPTLVHYGNWAALSTLISPLLVYLDRFALGAIVTVTAVAYYAPPFEMVMRLLLLPAALVGTLFPAFSALSGQRDDTRLRAYVNHSVRYIVLALGPVVVLLVAGARDLLFLWLGADYADHGALALQILAIGVLVNGIANVPFSLIQAVGRPDVTAKLHLLEIPLQIVLVIVLVRAWGIPGAALAWSLRVGLDCALLMFSAGRLSEYSLPATTFARVPQALALVVGLATSAALIVHNVPNLWARLLIAGGSLPLTALLLWRYSLAEPERTQLRALLQPAGGA